MYTKMLVDDPLPSYEVHDGIELDKLTTINIFIGQNNSGKSRFLRNILTNNRLRILSTSNGSSQIFNLLDRIKKGANDAIEFMNGAGRDADGSVHVVAQAEIKDVWRNPNKFSEIETLIDRLRNHVAKHNYNPGQHAFEKFLAPALREYEIASDLKLHKKREKKIYVPTLRGLRPVQQNENEFDGTIDSYRDRTIKDYFGPGRNFDGQILQACIYIMRRENSY